MKKLITLTFIAFTLTHTPIFSQVNCDTSSIVSIISENRDTLFLADTQLGRTISQTWYISSYNINRPIIIFKPHNWIIERKLKF